MKQMKRKLPKYGIHGMPMIIKWIREKKKKKTNETPTHS
jgi:hypothetical protein